MFALVVSIVCMTVVPAAPLWGGADAQDASATPDDDPAAQHRASASSKLLRAKRLVQELEYEQAREMVLEVLADPSAKPAERFSAAMLSGRIHVILERDVTARLHFLMALEIVPDANLPKGDPPKIRAFFDAVKAERAAERERGGTKTETGAPDENPDERGNGLSGTKKESDASVSSPLSYLAWGGGGLMAGAAATAILALGGGVATHFLVVQNVGMDVALRNVARPMVLGAAGVSMVAAAAVAAGGVLLVVGLVQE